MQWILLVLGMGEGRSTSRVGVKTLELRFKFCNQGDYNPLSLEGLPVAKAPIQNISDGEGRKLGERTGLDRLFDYCFD